MAYIRDVAFAAALLSAPAAFAGEQYLDPTVDPAKYAASGYDVVSYFALDQAPVGEAQPAPLPGSTAHTSEHNGSLFAFASAENLEAFLANPDRYAPAYDGHCAFGVAKGGKVPGNPTLWRIVDDRLYLNITEAVVGFWSEDIPGNIGLADTNWSTLEALPASADAVPEFSSSAPVN